MKNFHSLLFHWLTLWTLNAIDFFQMVTLKLSPITGHNGNIYIGQIGIGIDNYGRLSNLPVPLSSFPLSPFLSTHWLYPP